MHKVFGVLSLLWKLYIAIIFFIIAILMYPFFLIVLIRPTWKKKSFKLFILWSWMMRILCFYRIKTIESAELPEGPYVIVSNHTSYLDIFFMHSILPKYPFVFLGKSELLYYPIIRTYFKNLNIPVYRNDKRKSGQAYLLSEKAVKEGWSLVIFPEATISNVDCPKMLPFKHGAFKLAKSLNIPILPLTFTSNYKLFSDPTNILGPAQPGVCRLYIHPYISVETINKLEVLELTQKCFDIINRPILEEFPQFKD
jgi:1-acyl-sn-glycerol-3-phosphate acyltransferase